MSSGIAYIIAEVDNMENITKNKSKLVAQQLKLKAHMKTWDLGLYKGRIWRLEILAYISYFQKNNFEFKANW